MRSAALHIAAGLVLASTVAGLSAPARAQPPSLPESAGQTTPAATVEALHAGLYELASQSAADDVVIRDFDARYEALAPLIRETHDLAYIAEFTVRRQWPDLAEAEREAFVAAFERLSIATYVSRFTTIDEDTLQIEGTGATDGPRVEVRARIARDQGEDVSLDYLLHQREGRWQIINIVADGVSDLALKRAEYQRVLAAGGFDELLAHLRQQAEALAANAAQRTNR